MDDPITEKARCCVVETRTIKGTTYIPTWNFWRSSLLTAFSGRKTAILGLNGNSSVSQTVCRSRCAVSRGLTLPYCFVILKPLYFSRTRNNLERTAASCKQKFIVISDWSRSYTQPFMFTTELAETQLMIPRKLLP